MISNDLAFAAHSSFDEWAIFAMVICGLAIFTSFLTGLAKMHYRTKEKKQNSRGRLSDEESRMLEQLWNTARKMEERIMNLETILMQRTSESTFDGKR